MGIYLTFRYFFPAQEWTAFRTIFRTGNLYFRTQKYILEGEEEDEGEEEEVKERKEQKELDLKKENGHNNNNANTNTYTGENAREKNSNDEKKNGWSSISLPAKEKTSRMFLFHPHGLLTVGFGLATSAKFFSESDVKFLVTESLTMLPFIGDFVRWNSCYDCSPGNMKQMMKDKENIALIPGGFEETTLYERGKFRLYLKKRKGFIKYALQFGYIIHPIFVFGEEQTYYSLSGLTKFRLWLNSFKIPAILFMGRYGFLPHSNLDMVTVVGKGITFPKIEKPTSEDIDKYHSLYISKIEELFTKYKGKYAHNGEEAQLEIW